jgi:hypothetical protein
MKYAILAALLFVPLAVAGSYLSRDPTSAEAPKIELRTAEPVAKKPQPKRKAKTRKLEKGSSTVQRTSADRAAAPSRAGGTDVDDDKQEAPRSRGAAPVPIPAPARAGVVSDDERAAQGRGSDDDAAGGGRGRGDDGDD